MKQPELLLIDDEPALADFLAQAKTRLTYDPGGIVFEMRAPLPDPDFNEGGFP